jgi:uncharacterized protein YbcV (DUF1398 family)
VQEFLGFLLKQTNSNPQANNQEILEILPPCNLKKVRRFLRMINFIKNQIPNHANIMVTITFLTKDNQAFIWEEDQQGAILAQNLNSTEKVISVFSQKINDTQLTDTIGEQELLAAFEAC